MRPLKTQNLVSGFQTCGIFPLNIDDILKRLSTSNNTEEINEFSFKESILEVLGTNCGMGVQRKEY